MTLDQFALWVSLVASGVSLVLSIFAIWLSWQFYLQSNLSAERTHEASKNIQTGVEKLERLFQLLYSDTFSIMRDTYKDMRSYVWPQQNDQAQEQADQKLTELEATLKGEISTLATRLGETDTSVLEVRGKLEDIVDRAIKETRSVEAEASESTRIRNLSGDLWMVVFHQASKRKSHYVPMRDIYQCFADEIDRDDINRAASLLEKMGKIHIDYNITGGVRGVRPVESEFQP